ncbi:ATP-dependent DNA helicase RecG [Helicobacter sp. MIT 99-5507]|uniref:ATP-dependent DNA helicase RecG n=1 Tax=Helicobacter sp. MIT 99-5507 TaxID=152489 RepID=UPI000E1E7D95|nr:ATP-dependent DNA helicase RecG [Helicobacter sp. MIT 99-5507]RDU57948.1 ATP-dependent DNA helicase RecG [Helicobacter sp. MIT 99-5507]
MNRLAKIGINNLFEAILYTPKSYTNTTILKSLNKYSTNEGAVKIIINSKAGFGKTLKFQAYMLDLDENLEIIIFNPKPYHNKIFIQNKEMYIFGKFEYKYGIYTIVQPRITTNINQITLNFATTRIKNLNNIFREIISQENLNTLNFDDEIKKSIFSIFHPESDIFYLDEFNKNNGLFGKYLEAIKFVEIYYYMSELRKKRYFFEATSILNGDYKSFIKSLPFSLTNGQEKCIDYLSKKLDSKIATRCVVMGDVGCGKTIVILSCVMMAYPKKSILLAPTTILASQIYNEAIKFLPKNISVGLAIKDNQIVDCDFLIGTHSLLYKDISSFSLFMTDEQHRFGTNQRMTIEKMLEIDGKKPHSIQFSATPIPRTMALIESNIVDFCTIKDLPFKKDITSKIITKDDFSTLIAHIKEEIKKHMQIAIIYPLVEQSNTIAYQSIEEGLPFWQKNFKNVYSTHGKDKNKEEIIDSFRDNGDILIATTLFEVGISLPRLSTIIIVGAERLGFATLHQLRGRVSRNGAKGFCFLYTNEAKRARLNDFIKTNNGFEIAELDLKYRNSGDILKGIRQSGMQFKYFDIATDKEIANNAKNLLNEGTK